MARTTPGSREEIKRLRKEVAALKRAAKKHAVALQQSAQALADAEARATESLEQQTATAEILKVIASAPTDAQPVFDTIVRNAGRVCDAVDAVLLLREGDELTVGAHWGPIGAIVGRRFPLTRGTVMGRTIVDALPVHVEDLLTASGFPEGREQAMRWGHRTTLGVPLLREGGALGALLIRRTEARPFSDAQIAMLQTFADQAVIAIENVRLFKELESRNRDLARALEQQTATGEILRVISASPTDVQPVFDTIVRSASDLCGGQWAIVVRLDGELLHLAAQHNPRPGLASAAERLFPRRPGRDLTVGRAVLDGAVVHIPDVNEDAGYDARGGQIARAFLAVPMLREGVPIGAIGVSRAAPGPFAPEQIELLKTFADQAVIAIENARLFTELQASNRELTTALDQQTATSDILRVISQSQTDVQPVFDAIVASAVRLLGAYSGALTRLAGDQIELAALTSTDAAGDAGARAVYPQSLESEGPTAQAIRDRAPVNITDAQTDPRVGEAQRASARARGFRSRVVVPLLRHDEALGSISVSRREADGFTADEIALLQTFADQAVIAIENVRLFTELEGRNRDLTEALAQQTATAEILRVISSTPADTQPVFEAIVTSTQRLMAGKSTVLLLRRDPQFVVGAYAGPAIADLPDQVRAAPLDREQNFPSRAILDAKIVHIPDWEADGVPEHERVVGRSFGIRAGLMVPLLREGQGIGALVVTRSTAGPYDEKEIALLRSFADQAVIAIENVRLFNELQASNHELTTALDQQTATSDILRVISRSQTDVQPVFDAIVASAVRLLGAYSGLLTRVAGDQIELAALTSTAAAGDAAMRAIYPQSIYSEGTHAQAIRDRAPFNLTDAQTDPRVPEASHANARARGYQSLVAVPLLRQDQALGAISVTRVEPGGFSDDEIALLKTFADQAVIAIENVRLFTELEGRNRDLTATGEILRVISSSPTDVQPVFDTIVSSAVRLCDGLFSGLYQFDGELIHFAAQHNFTPEALEEVHRMFPLRPTRALGSGRAILERAVVHIPDIEADPEHEHRALTHAIGQRSGLWVPMLREGAPIGVIVVGRAEAGPFSDSEIGLLKTFADQAVIAVENVRLFNETRESLERQTATADILKVIASSPSDVQPVFDTIVESALALCKGMYANVFRYDGDMLHFMATKSLSPRGVEALKAKYPMRPDASQASGRVILTKEVVRIEDSSADPDYDPRMVWAGLWRRMLAVPMLREGAPLGVVVVAWDEPGRILKHHEELLQTFADQAVIAIENVRLFKELEARTTELTRSVDQLTALGEISQAVSSTLDVETVLQTIVSRASQLAGADGCSIYEYDDATEAFHIRATHNLDPDLVGTLRASPLRKGEGTMGRAAETREPTQIADIAVAGAYQSHIRDTLLGAGYRALLSVPLLLEGEVIGSLSLNRHAPGEFPSEVVEVLKTFATQSALAIQNARLFREIADKSRQLEAASRHKSEFLANMSHELRTPLNAIIGFSEVLNERMFGELNEKQAEYLKDIHASGQHLLSLINDILDLSKIEAGRMELELTRFDLPQAVDNALTLVRERAARRGIALRHAVDEGLGQVTGDERKIKQVLLNLLSNALKFTPEGGRIDVSAHTADGMAEISVTDTGIGIAAEHHGAVFEEFRQVGEAEKKAEGTGLGLALCRKFVELHGGRIWVKSQIGSGSTFAFTLPLDSSP